MKLAQVVVLLTAALAVTACSDEGEQSEAPALTPATIEGWNGPAARDACHDKVLDRLKSPSTAEFEGMFEVELSQSLSDWVVSGHVDSQNGFGATVRSDYSCTVIPQDADTALVYIDSLTER